MAGTRYQPKFNITLFVIKVKFYNFQNIRLSLALLALVLMPGLLTQCSSRGGDLAPPAPSTVLRAVPAEGKGELVNVRAIIPDIICELPYGTRENITRQKLYPESMACLLHPATAEKLRRAQMFLWPQGYRLKIWDAWRPPEVQLSLFEHGGYTNMFTDPKIMWSRHCSGTAVDVTLVDMQGREMKMPTKYDSGGPLAAYLYQGSDPDVRRNLFALQQAMLAAGFTILNTEWWHFDDADYNKGPVPPVVFAADIGMALPKIKPPAKRRR